MVFDFGLFYVLVHKPFSVLFWVFDSFTLKTLIYNISFEHFSVINGENFDCHIIKIMENGLKECFPMQLFLFTIYLSYDKNNYTVKT